MRKLMMLPVVMAVSLAAWTFAAGPVPADDARPATAALGQTAPEFSLQDSNGKMVNLADYKGKVVVLEWINQDCPIDSRVIDSKLISTVYEKFKDKVAWLAIDSTAAHTKADYEKTLARWKLPYPLLNDAKGTVGHLYKAQTTPHMYIINTDGKLVYMGGIDNDPNGTDPKRINYVDKALTELFAGKQVSISESKPYGCSVKYAN
jgi:peroxiredoxin